MTESKKPEELAFAATEMISDAVTKFTKKRKILLAAAGVAAIGMAIASPTSLLPVATFVNAYGLWHMHSLRQASLKLREAFQHVSEGLGEHDSVHQMDPLKRSFDKVKDYSKDDLNIMAHYRRNKVNTMVMGGIVLALTPVFLPLALSGMIAYEDQKRLKAIKDAKPEVQKNLLTKYPLTFDKPPEV